MKTSPLYDGRRDFTVSETSGLLGVTNPTVYKMIACGALDSYKVGRSRRITHESVAQLRRAG